MGVLDKCRELGMPRTCPARWTGCGRGDGAGLTRGHGAIMAGLWRVPVHFSLPKSNILPDTILNQKLICIRPGTSILGKKPDFGSVQKRGKSLT